MEIWELEARESIRDLTARYNANGDSGRVAHVVELFTEDAVMVVTDGDERHGRDEIATVFATASSKARWGDHPRYVRHMTSTHQIDLIDRDHAEGRCYYAVITAVGLDHWGRYLDRYERVGGSWKFSRRRVTVDGRSACSIFG